MGEEEYLRGLLAEMHRRYLKEAEPIIDALIRIENLKPPKPILMDIRDLPQGLIDQLKNMEKDQ